jgi:hypothetical protein
MPGKIIVIKEPTLHLGSKSYDLLDKVLYQVCQVNPDYVTIIDIPTGTYNVDTEKDVILAVGEKALNFFGLKGITKYAGKVQKIGTNQPISVVPIVSPGFLEYNPNYMRQWAEHIQMAYNLSIGIKPKEATNQFIIVEDLDTLRKLVQYCKQTGYCCFDFETTLLTDLGTFDPDFSVNTLSISFQPGSAFVIPLLHEESIFKDNIYPVIEILKEIFCNPHITKVGQNVKFDLHCAAWLGIKDHRGPYHDTMLLHQLIDENLSHKLKDIEIGRAHV